MNCPSVLITPMAEFHCTGLEGHAGKQHAERGELAGAPYAVEWDDALAEKMKALYGPPERSAAGE